MDIDLYKNIIDLYRKLKGDNGNNRKLYYEDNYIVYHKDDLNSNLLDQFLNIPFGKFYSDEHKKKYGIYYTDEFKTKVGFHKYFESMCILKEQNLIKIHWDFVDIIYYYLINYFKDDFQNLLNKLSDISRMGIYLGLVSDDKQKFTYDISINEEIKKYLKSNIPNFDIINNILINADNFTHYLNENNYIIINKEFINNTLKYSKTYNFENFDISSEKNNTII